MYRGPERLKCLRTAVSRGQMTQDEAAKEARDQEAGVDPVACEGF